MQLLVVDPVAVILGAMSMVSRAEECLSGHNPSCYRSNNTHIDHLTPSNSFLGALPALRAGQGPMGGRDRASI